MNKKEKKKNPLKLKACVVALSLWGFASPCFILSSAPVMAAETASHTAQEQEASALFKKGLTLYNLNRYEEALAVNNNLITRFGNSQNTKIQEAVAIALLNKGFNLYNLYRYKEALAVNNNLITRFGNSQNTKIQEAVANALVNKGQILTNLHRYEEAFVTYNELIILFSDLSYDPKIQELLATARYHLLGLKMILS